MEPRLQIVAVVASLGLLLIVFELLRRRHLLERYALLWLVSSVTLLVLAVWGGLLKRVSDLLGIFYPPNALFLIAFAFVLVLLLHFSLAISRLSDENKILAQRLAHLEREVHDGKRGEADDEADRDVRPNRGKARRRGSAHRASAEPSSITTRDQ